MATLQRVGRMLEKIFVANCDFWRLDLVIALFPRLMLDSVIRERSGWQKASGSLYARPFDTCTLCIIENRVQMNQGRR